MDIREIALGEGEITPQFLSEEEKELFAHAVLAEEAIRFLDTDLGRLLRSMAIQEREEAKEALLKVDAEDLEANRNLRFKAAVADQFLRFLQEVLNQGEAAHASLIQQREYQ